MMDPETRRLFSKLSLNPGTGRSPFELTPEETKFSPDDWAWQFLRLSPSYQQAFADYRKNSADSDFSKVSAEIYQPWRQAIVDEHICRGRYGLSTWLAPSCKRLPKSGDDGESWFFPLMKTPQLWRDADHEKRPYRPGKELKYGYARQEILTFKDVMYQPKLPYRKARSNNKKFLINCANPVNAQLRSVKVLCGLFRRADDEAFDKLAGMRDLSFARYQQPIDGIERPRRKVVKGSEPAVDNAVSAESTACIMGGEMQAVDVDLAMASWQVIEIDIHGLIQQQIDEHLTSLNLRHKQLRAARAVSGSWPTYYKLSVHSRSKVIDVPSDGNFLKALVLSKQLSLLGLSGEDIHRLFPGPSRSPKLDKNQLAAEEAWEEWMSGRARRISRFISQADEVINDGYRWLIHAQKP